MSDAMNCEEAEILLHALIDGELDAGHTSAIETHAANCASCAAKLAALRDLHAALRAAKLKEEAPAALRRRIEASLPAPPIDVRAAPRASRRSFFSGFAAGAALATVAATGIVIAVFNVDDEGAIADQVVSAHIRSLQPGHLTDVQTSDRHTVKPWFNGKLGLAPPVIDLTEQGFTLVGGRLDYIDGETVASIVYRHRKHIINLFVARHLGEARAAMTAVPMHGYNVRHWTQDGVDLWAISDIASPELDTFAARITAALRTPAATERSP